MKCEISVSQDGWHFLPCNKPAKYIYECVNGKRTFLCGIHARRFLVKNSSNLKPCEVPDVER